MLFRIAPQPQNSQHVLSAISHASLPAKCEQADCLEWCWRHAWPTRTQLLRQTCTVVADAECMEHQDDNLSNQGERESKRVSAWVDGWGESWGG